MTPFALGLVAVALAVLGRREGVGRPASWGLLLVAFGAPAAILLVSLTFAPAKASRYRLALLGVGVRGRDDAELVLDFGGPPEDPEIQSAATSGEPVDEASPLLLELPLRPRER